MMAAKVRRTTATKRKNAPDQKFKTLSRAVRLVNEFLMLQLGAGLKTTEKKCTFFNAG